MKRKTKLVTSFTRFNVVQLLDKAKHIALSLEGSPQVQKTLTAEVPFYDQLLTAIEALEISNERCKTDKTAYKERSIKQEELINVLMKIKSYLEAFYGDDPAILATTGYDLNKMNQFPNLEPP